MIVGNYKLEKEELFSNLSEEDVTACTKDYFSLYIFNKNFNWNINTDPLLKDHIMKQLDVRRKGGLKGTIAMLHYNNPDLRFYPIYVYKHGNVAFSLKPFADRFDSAFGGFLVVNKRLYLEENDNRTRFIITDPESKKSVNRFLDICEDYFNGYITNISIEVEGMNPKRERFYRSLTNIECFNTDIKTLAEQVIRTIHDYKFCCNLLTCEQQYAIKKFIEE